jgi:hypothetical protein
MAYRGNYTRGRVVPHGLRDRLSCAAVTRHQMPFRSTRQREAEVNLPASVVNTPLLHQAILSSCWPDLLMSTRSLAQMLPDTLGLRPFRVMSALTSHAYPFDALTSAEVQRSACNSPGILYSCESIPLRQVPFN